jgi:MerR family transcriptional regulator, copper efflux regulator
MLNQARKSLFIGAVAAQSGIPIKTIRYYEELGLIHSSGRSHGGFRYFAPDVLQHLLFIKRAQCYGLSLQEIGEFLKVYDSQHPPSREIKQKLQDLILSIEQRILQLQFLQAELNGLLHPTSFDAAS